MRSLGQKTPFAQSRHFEFTIVAGAMLLMAVIFPWCNAHGWMSDFTITLWGKYLCYALLAISVDLLWGYTGLLSLGQALFFSLGGYMLGMYLMLMIGPLGSYAKAGQNPNNLPDFMVFLGHTYLPPFWRPFQSFSFATMMVFALPGFLAMVFGFLAFRSRIKGVYFSILTQALTYGAALMFFRNDLTMGGNNGFTDFKSILGYSLVDRDQGPATMRGLFVASASVVLLVVLLCHWINGTKFGLVRRAIRDGENRTLFSGYATANYKLFVFVLSAMIAAVGGALFVPQAGIINPDQMTPDKSIEAVVWVAVGGRGTLIGPILGAISINAMRSWATHQFPDSWLIILGIIFLVVVLFLPGGLVSLPGKFSAYWKRRQKMSKPAEEITKPAVEATKPVPELP